MSNFHVAPRARADVADILERSQRLHGRDAADRYAALILRCFDVIEAGPHDCSHPLSDTAPQIRLIHLRTAAFSRQQKGRRVGRPRHVVLFRVFPNGDVEVSRMLHERMDYDQHLPGDLDLPSATGE